MTLGYEVTKAMVVYNFSIPKDKDDRRFSKMLMKQNIDVCRIAAALKGDQFTKMIREVLTKHTNFELKCPFKKVRKSLKNFWEWTLSILLNFYI